VDLRKARAKSNQIHALSFFFLSVPLFPFFGSLEDRTTLSRSSPLLFFSTLLSLSQCILFKLLLYSDSDRIGSGPDNLGRRALFFSHSPPSLFLALGLLWEWNGMGWNWDCLDDLGLLGYGIRGTLCSRYTGIVGISYLDETTKLEN